MSDISHIWRNAMRNPAISLLIVITLVLGIGTNAAMLSVAHRVLFAPLPFADGERLVTLEQKGAFTNDIPWLPATLEDFRAQTTRFDALLGYVQLEYALLGHGEPYFANVGIVNDDFFGELGIRPLLGRGFAPEDDEPGATPVMLLGNELWRTQFGANTEVIGTSLEMEGIVYTVIGVLPPLPAWPRTNAVWITWAGDRIMSNSEFLNQRSDMSGGIIWSVIGKLKQGMTLSLAQQEVDGVAKALQTRWPQTVSSDYQVVIHSLQTLLRGDSGALLSLLYGLSLLVLLIACANVASLHLARLAMRRQELAVREAIGASPARLFGQLLGESLVYAIAGGILGVLIAWLVLRLLSDFAVVHTALAANIGVADILVPVFGVALLAGVGVGLVATLGRADINQTLKDGGNKVTTSTSGVRRRRALLVLQLTLSFVMLTAAALLMLSLQRLSAQHPGYDVAQVSTANFQLNASYPTEAQGTAFTDRLLAEIDALPEVEVSAIAGAPLLRDPLYGLLPMLIEAGGERVETSAFSTVVTQGYFRTLGIPLLQGRNFAESDDMTTEPVAVVNTKFERTYFPGGALGQRLSFTDGNTWRTIVGVVGDVRPTALDREEGPSVYTVFRQRPTSIIHLFVRSRTASAPLTETIRATIHGVDSRIAIEEARPLEELRAQWLAPRALVAKLIMGIGVVALLISGSGVVGIVSYNVNRSVREIGVRAAVGATPRNILWLFMRQGLSSHLWGLLLGLLLMLGIALMLEPLLYQTTGFDMSAYFASALVLSMTVLVAVYLPAARASVLDPVVALHHE
jgi:predicted permease